MARKRMIHPSLATSLTVSQLPVAARYGWVLLIVAHLDDEGRGRDNAPLIKAALWPFDKAQTDKKVDGDLALYARHGLICRYPALDGTRCLHALNWDEYQTISHPTPSKVPPCPFHELGLREQFRNDSGEIREGLHPSVVEVSSVERSEVEVQDPWSLRAVPGDAW